MTRFDDLPAPTPAASDRSLALLDVIQQSIIEHGGQIAFSELMALALYHPEFGYYNAAEFTIGKQGDFTTAPEISPLFAMCLATQCEQMLRTGALPDILELGPGTGQLALDLLLTLEQQNALPAHYYLYEINEKLKRKQQQKLQALNQRLGGRIIWLDQLPTGFKGTIIANEVLDALPVDCFYVENGTLWERCVGLTEQQLGWQLRPASPQMTQALAELALPEGYQSEINLGLPAFLAPLCHSLEKGIILLADYGYGSREYYHPERCHGTLTCFYRHHKHANPLILPGLQDITAHVDFTRVIEEASAAGCALAGYTTQAGFLLATGLLSFAAKQEIGLTPKQEFELHQAVKLLTLPTEMGERVKFMALAKGVDMPLVGFSLQDRRREL